MDGIYGMFQLFVFFVMCGMVYVIYTRDRFKLCLIN